jgi:hypothetical protein
MLAGRNKTLKPQDVLLLLKMLAMQEKSWRIIDLAHELNISPGEITHGLERLKLSGLIDAEKRTVHKSCALEFLLYGLKYVFPAQMGTINRGVPTAHSYFKQFVNDTNYVWASEEGNIKGISISPIYESAPFAALKDEKLHRLLALVDAIRVGRVREQNYAKHELEMALN